ncbi:MAG TPA: preprotein translocase subunit YajC [Caulobacteraceae bacterium]|nr:preprotein translocase subunit YajC [Caulobacteraceae bacterium]
MSLPTALVLAAVAPAAGGDNGIQDFLANPLIFVGVMIVLMYFMLFRPQQQRAKEHQAKIAGIKRGDTVVLSGGLIGKVVRVEDQEVGLEIAQNVTVKVVKSMITDVRARGEPAPANANAKPQAAKAGAKDAKS